MKTPSIKNILFAVAISAVMLTSPTLADDSPPSQEKISKQTALAEQGNANAQAWLGFMYYAGQGVPQDYSEAMKWYRKAAEQGNAQAQFNLGVMYAKGQGVSQDYSEAVKWKRMAAEQGNAQAQSNLGFIYQNGQGVPKDDAEAMKWFSKSAEQGFASAQYHLALMYEDGQGVPQDYSEAAKWYRKAAEQGDAYAQYNLGILYKDGQGVPKDDAEAMKWFSKSAEQGFASAQSNLGIMYILGRGVTKDEKKGVQWVQKAANQGDESAKKVLREIQKIKASNQQALTPKDKVNVCIEKCMAEHRGTGGLCVSQCVWEVGSKLPQGKSAAGQGNARCDNKCSGIKAACDSNNTDTAFGAMAVGGMNLESAMVADATSDDCNEKYTSCMENCK